MVESRLKARPPKWFEGENWSRPNPSTLTLAVDPGVEPGRVGEGRRGGGGSKPARPPAVPAERVRDAVEPHGDPHTDEGRGARPGCPGHLQEEPRIDEWGHHAVRARVARTQPRTDGFRRSRGRDSFDLR